MYEYYYTLSSRFKMLDIINHTEKRVHIMCIYLIDILFIHCIYNYYNWVMNGEAIIDHYYNIIIY